MQNMDSILDWLVEQRLNCLAINGGIASEDALFADLTTGRIKNGDTIVFDSVSRMSRNAEEGFTIYEELYQRGISLVFLKEPHISTDTYRKALTSGVPLTGTNVD